MVDISVAVNTLKSIGAVVRKAGSIDLTAQLIDVQTTLLDLLAKNTELVDQNARLSSEIRELREAAAEGSRLVFERQAYWRAFPSGKEGPLCSNCWDQQRKTIRLHDMHNGYCQCPSCERVVQVYPEREEQARPQGGQGFWEEV